MLARPLLLTALVLTAGAFLSSCDSAPLDTPDASFAGLAGTITRELPPIRADLPVTFRATGRTRLPSEPVTLVVVNRLRDTLFVGGVEVAAAGRSRPT